jgi:acetylornithine deacetylase/succinyl-diaminopimelate desuccinylase-like protein
MVVAALEEFVQTLPADAVLGMPTVTPTMLETVPRGGNVIPEIVRITVDCRIMPGQSDAWLLEKLSGYLADRVPPGETGLVSVRCGVDVERAYTGLELRRTRLTPGYLLVSTERAVQVACETVAVATGRRPAVRPWQFGTDGGHSCGTHGIPTIGYAPGDEALAHSNRERLELAAARQVYGVYPQLMRALQRA